MRLKRPGRNPRKPFITKPSKASYLPKYPDLTNKMRHHLRRQVRQQKKTLTK